MSRECRDNGGEYQIVYGVDFGIEPGASHTFVQVFKKVENEFDELVFNEWNVSVERVLKLAKDHGVYVEFADVWKTFD